MRLRVAHGFDLERLAVLLDFAGLNRTQAEQSLDHLGTLRAYQAADAQNLALM